MSLARVACVIPAKDEVESIAETVRVVSELPGVALVVVADDGSADDTAQHAGAAGAIVVSHRRSRGKAAAVESAVNAIGVAEQRDGRPACGSLLLVDADTGAAAARLGPILSAVTSGGTDLAIAAPSSPDSGLLAGTAARGIHSLTGWTPVAPLASQRCLTRQAFELASPLAAGYGLEVGMAVDLRRAGLRITEIELDAEAPEPRHATDLSDRLRQAARLRDITRALAARGLVQSGLTELKESGGLGGLLGRFRR